MKLPCTINKFFIYEIILSENIFRDDWKSTFHVSQKIRIDKAIANSLEELQKFFPNSQIFENSIENSSKLEDFTSVPVCLCGKFKLIFYEDFDYNYKIYINKKKTYITMEISYPEKEFFDPRQKFIGEIILENYRKLFNPVN